MNKSDFKALCYPGKARNTPLDTLMRLALSDGKQVLKGVSVRVLDVLWSDVCSFPVVVVGAESTVDKASVIEDGKSRV